MPPWSLRCPYGHASVKMGAHRFWCEACRVAGHPAAYPKTDLVDLSKGEEPPHA